MFVYDLCWSHLSIEFDGVLIRKLPYNFWVKLTQASVQYFLRGQVFCLGVRMLWHSGPEGCVVLLEVVVFVLRWEWWRTRLDVSLVTRHSWWSRVRRLCCDFWWGSREMQRATLSWGLKKERAVPFRRVLREELACLESMLWSDRILYCLVCW